MNSFNTARQAELRKEIEQALLDVLDTFETSARIISSSIEFTPLQPKGMGLNLRFNVQVTERDKKEEEPV